MRTCTVFRRWSHTFNYQMLWTTCRKHSWINMSCSITYRFCDSITLRFKRWIRITTLAISRSPFLIWKRFMHFLVRRTRSYGTSLTLSGSLISWCSKSCSSLLWRRKRRMNWRRNTGIRIAASNKNNKIHTQKAAMAITTRTTWWTRTMSRSDASYRTRYRISTKIFRTQRCLTRKSRIQRSQTLARPPITRSLCTKWKATSRCW